MTAPKIKNDKFLMGFVIVAIIISAFLLSVAMASLPPLRTEETSENGSASGNSLGGGTTGVGRKQCSISTEGGVPSNNLVLEIYGKTKTPYLRETAAAQYESTKWTMGPDDKVVSYDGDYISQEIGLYSARDASSVSIKVENEWSGFVPTIYHANKIGLQNIQLEYYPSQQIFYAVDSFIGRYNVDFTHFEFNSDLLAKSQLAPQNSSSVHLQLPDSLRNKVQDVLNQLSLSRHANSYSKIIAIQSYLQTNYKYDSTYTRAPAGQDLSLIHI